MSDRISVHSKVTWEGSGPARTTSGSHWDPPTILFGLNLFRGPLLQSTPIVTPETLLACTRRGPSCQCPCLSTLWSRLRSATSLLLLLCPSSLLCTCFVTRGPRTGCPGHGPSTETTFGKLRPPCFPTP